MSQASVNKIGPATAPSAASRAARDGAGEVFAGDVSERVPGRVSTWFMMNLLDQESC
jgi:hypothetical protein